MGISHRPLALAFAFVSLGLVACAGSGPGGGSPPDADPFRPDAKIPECTTGSAVIGRCELETGGACTGVPDEPRVFIPLSAGDPVPMVVGPQASLMFVLALQTTDIYAGDPNNPASADNPNVEITLLQDGVRRMAWYRGRPYFEPDSVDTTMLEASGLFVIVQESAADLDGVQVTAVAELTDKDGAERCGTIDFIAQK